MIDEFSTWSFWGSCAALALAGLVRGFAGFGSAMVMMPALAAIHGPAVAVPIALMLEIGSSLQMLPQSVRLVAWREIGVLTVAACLLTPLGTWILLTLDPLVMRWAVSAVVLSAVTIMAFGWRYAGAPSVAVTGTAGALSGLLNGASGMAGPPVIFYYMSSEGSAARVRANLIAYFLIVDAFAMVALALGGAVTLSVLRQAVLLAVPLVLGTLVGMRLFTMASEAFYRRAALIVLAAIALGSLLL